jgi:tetratricopeptide (TPR) repeat protein
MASFSDPPDGEARTWQEAEREIEALLNSPYRRDLDVLPYYLLDERLWRWSLRQKEARHWLMCLRLFHAHDQRLHLRWDLVEQLLSKAREAVPEEQMSLDLRLRHAIVSARLAVCGGHRPTPERGIRLLQPWVEASRSLPVQQAWILSDIAKYAALWGTFDSALSLAEQACQAAQRTDSFGDLWLRHCDYGALLADAGRPKEAMAVISDPNASEWNGHRIDHESGNGFGEAHLAWAEAHYASGNLSEAQTALSKAQQILETAGIPEEKHRAAALAARLQSA